MAGRARNDSRGRSSKPEVEELEIPDFEERLADVSAPDLDPEEGEESGEDGSEDYSDEFDVDAIVARIEKQYRTRIPDDDVIRIMMAGTYEAIRQGSQKSIQMCIAESATAMEEFHRGLNYAANEKKLEVRQELIQHAKAIKERLRIEANELHGPLVQRIGDLERVAAKIAGNYSNHRWKDRIVGIVIGLVMVLLGFGGGLIFALKK